MKKLNKRECILWITIIVLIGVVFYNGRKIDDLKQQMYSMENRWMNELSLVENSVLISVKKQLQEQASLISDIQYEIGDLDAVTGKVSVFVSALLKTYAGDTRVSLTIRGEEIVLEKNEDRFEAVIPVDLFCGSDEQLMLKVITAEKESVEYLEQISIGNLWREVLPSIQVNSTHSNLTYREEMLVSANGEGTLKVSNNGPGANFTSYEIQTKVNGEIIFRQDITQEVISSNQFMKDGSFPLSYYFELEGEKREEVSINLVAVDSLGYRHEQVIRYYRERPSGVPDMQAPYEGECIYDSQGYLRYGAKYAGYYD